MSNVVAPRLQAPQVSTSAVAGKKIAYLMSRFPKISETFILYEILELQRLGMQVEIFPLLRETAPVMHSEARALVERAHYTNILTKEVLQAQRYWLRRQPAAYLHAWVQAIRGNASSPKSLSRALVVVPQAALFAQRMVELGVSHLHAHWATHPALAAYVVGLLTGLPYSFTAHADDIYVERPMLDEKIRRAHFVVTISEYNKRFLSELYGEAAASKIAVVHCGVDSSIFTPRAPAPSNSLFTIVCVARLEQKKGHTYLVEACAQLKAQGLSFRCMLVGDGEERPQIESQIKRLGLEDTVILLGQQPRSRVAELLAEADVMVLPSVTTAKGRQEGIPVALMEALATELPVVASAISGIPELVEDGHTGLLVPERDPTALATALARLHSNPELGRRLGAAGRIKVQREFDLQRNTATLHHMFTHDWGNIHHSLAQPARYLA
ncbi:MAG: glycosyltransferase [Roseiflexaceae bacterium]|nr:glycosyltransferase [Roseiflexaceae bacterium]